MEGSINAVMGWEEGHWVPCPWRVDRIPYKVLIAEVLLRRTTGKAVSGVYRGFLAEFPDTGFVYKADPEELESALRPIGLYKQAAGR